MMTTDNSTPISEDEANHKDTPDNDNGKTQTQIDREERDALVKAEVPAPISESQVEPGREVVDGNGRRDTEDVVPNRPDVIHDPNADTQHAREVQAKEEAKLRGNNKLAK